MKPTSKLYSTAAFTNWPATTRQRSGAESVPPSYEAVLIGSDSDESQLSAARLGLLDASISASANEEQPLRQPT